jgi:hypothetical protein
LAARTTLKFSDPWQVRATPEQAFAALANLAEYPCFAPRTYRACEAVGDVGVGQRVRVHIQGPLPLPIRFEAVVVHYDPPHEIRFEGSGDFDLRWRIVLTPSGDHVNIASDMEIVPARPLPKLVQPLMLPLFHWNHRTMMARAYRGLEEHLAAQR